MIRIGPEMDANRLRNVVSADPDPVFHPPHSRWHSGSVHQQTDSDPRIGQSRPHVRLVLADLFDPIDLVMKASDRVLAPSPTSA